MKLINNFIEHILSKYFQLSLSILKKVNIEKLICIIYNKKFTKLDNYTCEDRIYYYIGIFLIFY
jgi:hypothetical protein